MSESEEKGFEDLSQEGQDIVKTMREEISEIRSEVYKQSKKLEVVENRTSSEVHNVENPERFVEENDKVIIDIYSENCIPCYMYSLPLEKIAREKDNIKIGKVDIEKSKDIVNWAVEYSEGDGFAIPLILSFEDGELVNRMVGSPSNRSDAYKIVNGMAQRLIVSNKDFYNRLEWAREIADNNDWFLNPNEAIRDGVIASLAKSPYCPCKVGEVMENVCPCDPYEDFEGVESRIAKGESCLCGLFVPKED